MKRDLSRGVRRKQVLGYVLDKGFDGASIREIGNQLRESDQDVPIAAIISLLDRLVESGQLIEKRNEVTQGYFRRLFDPRYVQNNNRS